MSQVLNNGGRLIVACDQLFCLLLQDGFWFLRYAESGFGKPETFFADVKPSVGWHDITDMGQPNMLHLLMNDVPLSFITPIGYSSWFACECILSMQWVSQEFSVASLSSCHLFINSCIESSVSRRSFRLSPVMLIVNFSHCFCIAHSFTVSVSCWQQFYQSYIVC